jgi:hypothetical protein
VTHFWFDATGHFPDWSFYQSPDDRLWAVNDTNSQVFFLAQRRSGGYFLDRYRDVAISRDQPLPQGLMPLKDAELELTALAFHRAFEREETQALEDLETNSTHSWAAG